MKKKNSRAIKRNPVIIFILLLFISFILSTMYRIYIVTILYTVKIIHREKEIAKRIKYRDSSLFILLYLLLLYIFISIIHINSYKHGEEGEEGG